MWRFLVVFGIFTQCESVSLTYFSKRDGTRVHPSCLAEGLERYAALGWIYPMPEDGVVANTTTKYIPSLQNDYNCKFFKNDPCNVKWSGRDWKLDETSTKTRQFFDDNRWEDLPTIFVTNSTDFEKRFHLENSKTSSFSVRGSGIIEILLSTGWNPYNYPSYYFQIRERQIVFKKLSKYDNLDMEEVYRNPDTVPTLAAADIIAEDEWRSFEVSFLENGTITFVDKNNERLLLTYLDKDPLRPMYLLMRSTKPSLWKVLENFFMYTETAQTSRLGPQIETTYKDLCVSLLLASCSNCQMSFFYLNGTRNLLKIIPPTNDKWMEVKLKQENIKLDRFNIFVQTEFLNKSDTSGGWWAIDDVRVCNENEVKVTFLNLTQTFAMDDDTVSKGISCQLINNPKYRPFPIEYNQIEDKMFADFPPVEVTSNDTSISLKWPEEDPDHFLTYFVYYQAREVCKEGMRRRMSGGFLTTKQSLVVIEGLVPYTTYDVTLSSVLHEKDKLVEVKTLETEEPTLDEIPINLYIFPRDTAVNVSWNEPNCNRKFGRLIYNIIITSDGGFEKILEGQVGNSHLIEGLQPYSKHMVVVATARNNRNLQRGVFSQNVSNEFMTLAGVAPPVENLELYSMSPTKASLRYNLPQNSPGKPRDLQVTRCNVLSVWKCKSIIGRITPCVIWPNKMCVDVDYLIPKQNYTFKVSLKNAQTSMFGKEVTIGGESIEHPPNPPENMTYQVVDCQQSTDYCNLNISWLHPYNPRGSITSFNILLNSTYFNSSSSEEDQSMHEVYKVINDSYLPQYTYQVKYVPYSKEYHLYIQSANNAFKSPFVSTLVKTADLGDHIDQKPIRLGNGDKAILFKLPPLDKRLDHYHVTIGVQDYNQSIPLFRDSIKNPKLADNVCHPYGLLWTSQVLKVSSNETKTVTIRGLDEIKDIKPNTKYCIIFVITNTYRGEEHDVVYYEKLTTATTETNGAEGKGSSHLWMLLFLLLLVPLAFGVYWYIKKRNSRSDLSNPDHHYETVPFKDQKDYANNRTYDHLIHK